MHDLGHWLPSNDDFGTTRSPILWLISIPRVWQRWWLPEDVNPFTNTVQKQNGVSLHLLRVYIRSMPPLVPSFLPLPANDHITVAWYFDRGISPPDKFPPFPIYEPYVRPKKYFFKKVWIQMKLKWTNLKGTILHLFETNQVWKSRMFWTFQYENQMWSHI